MTDSVSTETMTFETPLGGVMTREVGAITGSVEIWIDAEDPDGVRIRYEGAEDIYTVEGKAGGRDLASIRDVLVADPGVDVDDNPKSTSLA